MPIYRIIRLIATDEIEVEAASPEDATELVDPSRIESRTNFVETIVQEVSDRFTGYQERTSRDVLDEAKRPEMAIVTVPKLYLPGPVFSGNGVPSAFSNQVLNASGHKSAAVFLAPKAGAIRKIGMRFGAITTATDTDFRLETVSAQHPSGTLWAANTNLVVAAASLVANDMNIATLTADATVAKGDRLAIVIAPADTADYIITRHSGNMHRQSSYADVFTTSWAVQTVTAPVAIVEYSDGSYAYMPGVVPIDALGSHTFNSSTTPNHFGMRFKFPKALRVSGGWAGLDLDNDMDMVLIDSDGTTVKATASLTNALRIDTAGRSPFMFRFDTPQELAADTYYYLAAKPGASSITIFSLTAPSAGALDMLVDTLDAAYVNAKDPTEVGSWTVVETRVPFMGIEIDGL